MNSSPIALSDGFTPATVILKTVVVHTVTYFIAGILAFTLLDYEQLFSESGLQYLMRPTGEELVMAGPLFQPLRGLLFGGMFYLLRGPLFGQGRGWLMIWGVLVVFGYLGTFGPAPGSIEGMIYTILPMHVHLSGIPEFLVHSLLLSSGLFYWVRNPDRRWFSMLMSSAFIVVVALIILGLIYG